MPTPIPGMLIENTARELMGGLFGSGERTMRNVARSVGVLLCGFLMSAGLGVGAVEAQAVRIGQAAPDVAGERWINSEPLTMPGLRGRVVLVEFWTFG